MSLIKGPAGTASQAYPVFAQTPRTVPAETGRQGRLASGVGPSLPVKRPGGLRWSSSKLPRLSFYLPPAIAGRDKWGKLSSGTSTTQSPDAGAPFRTPQRPPQAPLGAAAPSLSPSRAVVLLPGACDHRLLLKVSCKDLTLCDELYDNAFLM